MYEERADLLQSANQHLQRRVFVSTEDPAVVDHFVQNQGWQTQYVNVTRYNNTQTSPFQHAQSIGVDNEVLNSLLNLQLALECDGWVGTITSNWGRLIEELRSTVGCKAHMPYIDAAMGTSISDYNW